MDEKKRAARARRDVATESADGCPLEPFANTFRVSVVPEGWHVVDPPETALRGWEKDRAVMHLVPGTPYSQTATPRRRVAILDSFGWFGEVSVGYSLEFTYSSCEFSLVGEGASEEDLALFAGALRAR